MRRTKLILRPIYDPAGSMHLNPSYEATIKSVVVTFFVSAPDLDPRDVSAAVGIAATSSARRGDERRNALGDLLRPEHEGWWALSTRGRLESKDIDEHFRDLLGRLLPHRDAFLAFARGGETYFDVIWKSNYLYAGSGPLLAADVIVGVAALGASMGFDIYQVDELDMEDATSFEK